MLFLNCYVGICKSKNKLSNGRSAEYNKLRSANVVCDFVKIRRENAIKPQSVNINWG